MALLLSSSQSDIPLIINHWAQRAAEYHSSPQENEGKLFLQAFIDISIAHGLGAESHPISILKDALEELSNDNIQMEGCGSRRIAHKTLFPSFTAQLREFVFDEIPVVVVVVAFSFIVACSTTAMATYIYCK